MTRARKDRNAVEQIEWMRNLLAFLLVGAFVAMIGGLMVKAIPTGNEDVITYMLGQLSGMALTALGFYFVNKAGQDALDSARTENTGRALDAITATAQSNTPSAPPDAAAAADQVAGAAEDEADKIRGQGG